MHKQLLAQVPEWIGVCRHVFMKHTKVMMPTVYHEDKAGDILDFVILNKSHDKTKTNN